MKYETLLMEIKAGVGTITLNRPEKFNTFSTRLARELNSSLRALDDDETVRVVVIGGEENKKTTPEKGGTGKSHVSSAPSSDVFRRFLLYTQSRGTKAIPG